MKKRVLSMLLAVTLMLSLAACGAKEETTETETTDEVEIGTVVVGIDGTYPPYNYMDDNEKPTGFEIAMIDEIAARQGFAVEYQALAWDGIFGQLESGKIDTIACCVFPNEERQKKYIFCREYIYDENCFITLAGQGDQYQTYEDLAGKKIGVTGGGNTYDTLAKLQEEVDFEIVAYNGEGHANDLALGRLDLIYKSPVSAFVQAKELGVEFEMAACPTLESASCSLPFRMDDERAALICDLFSESISEMIEDGTMKELSEEWLGMDLSAYDPLYNF